MFDPVRQIRGHVDALRAAGVEFVPARFALPVPPAEPAGGGEVPAEASPAGPPAAPDDRRRRLELLAAEVAGCDRCPELFSTRTRTVFGAGKLSPAVCFVGEAPGADEDRTGEPFVGAAGQLLTKIIQAMGLTRDEVYILNTLKCRPPRNRDPSAAECRNCRDYFDRQLDLVAPELICCLGAVAARNVLGTSAGITRLRGQVHRYRAWPVVCTYHPSYLLRLDGAAQQRAKAECWADMKAVLAQVGRPIPRAGERPA